MFFEITVKFNPQMKVNLSGSRGPKKYNGGTHFCSLNNETIGAISLLKGRMIGSSETLY